MLAQIGGGFHGWAAGWTWVDLCIFIIIIAGCVAIVYVVLTKLGWTPPQWLLTIIGIVVACFVGIVAIRLIASM